MTEQSENKPQPAGWKNLLIEFGPLALFFIANGQYGIIAATGVFTLAVIISMVVSKLWMGRIPVALWISGFVVTVFGGLTIYLQDETFIKIKPTIVSGLFAVVLLGGWLLKKPLLSHVMGHAMPGMQHAGWLILSRNWGLFFLLLAVLNEIVWRNFSTDFWVNYKVFGILPLTLIFAISQAPTMMKYNPDLKDQNQPKN